MIEPSDPRLAPYRLVGDGAALERDGLFVAEGRLVVERLLTDRRFEVHSVAVTAATAAALAGILERRPDVPVCVCEAATLRAITGFDFHRGCLALGRRPKSGASLGGVASASLVLGLEGIADPDNVGGLFRTALAFGVGGIVLDAATGDPLYRKAIRTSMAATLRVPFARLEEWLAGLEALRAAGLTLVALTPHPRAVPLTDFAARAPARVALLAGSEGFGLNSETLRRADVQVRIPVDPRADSLNVVNAAAIALYALAPPLT
jgi:tRNA G18 (ribose-2'-O)-methylase SpoU